MNKLYSCFMKIKIELYCPHCQETKIKKNGKNIQGSRIICAKIVDVSSLATMLWIIKAIIHR
jgi:hypothetical protein